jgi:NAD(P)-dependent dehydrogenase (short-subunit alcohol dehydrogenase family)
MIGRMVNNAGISIEAANPQPIHTTSEETWDITMRVNVKSVFLGCKYAVQQMLKQDVLPCGSRGWIVNISSIYGVVAGERIVSYCASKGAVSNLTRAVALDCSQYDIHCNAICPGRK